MRHGARRIAFISLVASAALASVGSPQSVTRYRFGPPWSTFVVRQGNDTIAIDRFQLTRSQLRGSMVQRTAEAVIVTSYYVEYGRSGLVSIAEFGRKLGDGSAMPGEPRLTRIETFADSVVRETSWPQRTDRTVFTLKGATVAFPDFVYGPVQLLGAIYKASNGFTDSIAAAGPSGAPGFVGLEPVGGDTLRLRGVVLPVRLVFEELGGILLSVDGRQTALRFMATLSVAGGVDIELLARRMKPLGTGAR